MFERMRERVRRWQAKRICRRVFAHDAKQFYAHNMDGEETATRRLARIMKRCHVLEKGLTMPGMRLGFGKANLLALLADIRSCADDCDSSQPSLLSDVIGVVAEYADVHRRAGFALDSDLSAEIDGILVQGPGRLTPQPRITREEYFSVAQAPFDVFSASRHSIRAFEGAVDVDAIRRSVELANNAPSACNRQPCRVHLVCSRALVQRCLALQNGNRGFGDRVDKLLVLTADAQTVRLNERNDLYTTGGIYLMNLCYALHFNKIAHCILNWSPEHGDIRNPFVEDLELRKLLTLSPYERVVAFVACGGLPDTFNYACSRRKTLTETLITHEE